MSVAYGVGIFRGSAGSSGVLDGSLAVRCADGIVDWLVTSLTGDANWDCGS